MRLTRIAAACRRTPYEMAYDPWSIYSIYDQRFDLLEMRVVAAKQEGRDLHRATAARLFDVPYGAVTEAQRRYGKLHNFRSLYG